MRRNAELPAALLGMSLFCSGFAMDVGLSVGNQILAPGPYQSYEGAPLTCALAGLTAEQSLGSIATASVRVSYVGGSGLVWQPMIEDTGYYRVRTVANGLEGRFTAAARMQLKAQRLTATAGLWPACDLLHETEPLVGEANISGFTQGVAAGLRVEPTRNLAVCADVELP